MAGCAAEEKSGQRGWAYGGKDNQCAERGSAGDLGGGISKSCGMGG